MSTYTDIKKIIAVTLPILVAQLSTMGVNFINTIMAGHAGTDDLAGVSVGAGLFYPFEAAAIGLLMAGTPIIAQLLGKGDRKSIPFVVRTGLYIAAMISFIFIAAYILLADSILAGMGLDHNVYYVAKFYILAMVAAVVFISLIIPFRALTDTVGRTTTSMKLFILALPLNAALNYLFIFGNWGFPRLGGIGAGVSAAVTYFIILMLFLYILFQDKRFMGKEIFASWSSRGSDWKEYLNVGIPSGLSVFLEMGLFGAIIIFMARFGTETLAAYQIADNFANMAYMVPLSCSMALTILVAEAAGGNNHGLAKRYAKAGILLSVGFSAVEVALTMVLKERIGMIYTDNPEVILIASQFLIYASCFQFFDSVAGPVQGVLRGYKDARVPFLLLLVSYWVVCFPLSLALDHIMGLEAVSYWMGLVVGVGVASVLMTLRLLYLEHISLPELLPFWGTEKTAGDFYHTMLRQVSFFKAGMVMKAERQKSLVLQYSRSVGRKDIYVPQKTVLEISMHVLTLLHMFAVGHARKSYVP